MQLTHHEDGHRGPQVAGEPDIIEPPTLPDSTADLFAQWGIEDTPRLDDGGSGPPPPEPPDDDDGGGGGGGGGGDGDDGDDFDDEEPARLQRIILYCIYGMIFTFDMGVGVFGFYLLFTGRLL